LIAARAEAAGLRLSYASSSVGLFRVTLDNVKIGLVGAPHIVGVADHVTVETSLLTLRKVSGQKIDVEATGATSALGRELSAWSKAYPGTSTLASSFAHASLTVRPRAGSAPLLALRDARVEARDGTWHIQPTASEAYGASLGPTELVVRASPERSTLFVGGTERDAPVIATLDVRGAQPVVTAELRPTSLALTASGSQSFEARGKATVNLLDDGGLEGSFTARLGGFVPPGPKEIRGLFGAGTDVSGSFATKATSSRVELTDVRLVAGALALRGKGHAEVPGTYALVDLSLAGALPCNLLGAAVATNTVPGPLGGLLGGLVKSTVSGDVPVQATLHADTRALAEAKVATTAEIRCGLGR
jgi:hypothetical protein